MANVQIPDQLNPKNIALERIEEVVNCLGNLTDITPEDAPDGTVEFLSGKDEDPFFYTREACEIINVDFNDVMRIFRHCSDDADIVYSGFEPYDRDLVRWDEMWGGEWSR